MALHNFLDGRSGLRLSSGSEEKAAGSSRSPFRDHRSKSKTAAGKKEPSGSSGEEEAAGPMTRVVHEKQGDPKVEVVCRPEDGRIEQIRILLEDGREIALACSYTAE